MVAAAAIGDEGCTTLAEVIKNNKLRSLELINAAAKAPGMQVLSNVLRTNASLKNLVLDHNPIGAPPRRPDTDRPDDPTAAAS